MKSEHYLVKYIVQMPDGSLYVSGSQFDTISEAENFSKTVKLKGICFVTREPVTKVVETDLSSNHINTYYHP